MKALSEIPASFLRGLKILAFDVDGTVTRNHQFDADFIRTCRQIQALGIKLVAVTGRSMAFGRILVDFFGLDAAIAEGGSVCMYRLRSEASQKSIEGIFYFEDDHQKRIEAEHRLEETIYQLKQKFPDMDDAEDQTGRKYDRAFLLYTLKGETLKRADEIIQTALASGIMASRSNVHINMWVGDFHKWVMFEKMLRHLHHDFGFQSMEEAEAGYVYIGDSLNDAPMFQQCHHSVGVAQVVRFEDRLQKMKALPHYVTEGAEVDGFYELCELIQSVYPG